MNNFNKFDTNVAEEFDELVYSDYEFADDIAMIMDR